MRNRVRTTANSHAGFFWGLLVSLSVCVSIGGLACALHLWQDSSAAAVALKITADGLLIAAPYWLLPSRLRWMSLIAVWGMAVMALCDAVYFRFFNDCMPLSALLQTGNAEEHLTASVLEELRLSDIALLLPPVALTSLWCLRGVRRAVVASAIPVPLRASLCLVAALLWLAAQAVYNGDYERRYAALWNERIGTAQLFRLRWIGQSEAFRESHISAAEHSGVAYYMLWECYRTWRDSRRIVLDDERRAHFDSLLLHEVGTDSLTTKNVIFIIAESLNADVFGRRIGGEPVTPVLDSLIAAEGSFSCTDVRTQVGKGLSCDGQMMYNLGLLPKYDGPVIPRDLRGKRLPSLAAMLKPGFSSLVLMAENGRVWNEADLFGDYAYDAILTSRHTRNVLPFDSLGADMATMRYAAMLADSLSQPFFMQILTISSHHPFAEKQAHDFFGETAEVISADERRYLRCIHYLDSSIGCLIEQLRLKGRLGQTMIIVASDHHMNTDGSLLPQRPIAFVAANCGLSGSVAGAAQADIFPTVCDLLGLKRQWRGVGRSMLRPDEPEPDYVRLREISDSLIRSDYFR